MPDPNPYPETDDDTGVSTGAPTTGMPRWVKAFVIVAIVLAVLAVLLLTGVFGGDHGPGRHIPGG